MKLSEIEITPQGVTENLMAGLATVAVLNLGSFLWKRYTTYRVQASNTDLTGLWFNAYIPKSDSFAEIIDILHIKHSGNKILLKEWYYQNTYRDIYKYFGNGILVDNKIAAYYYGTEKNKEEIGTFNLRFQSGNLIGGVMQFSLFLSDTLKLKVNKDFTYYKYKVPFKHRLRIAFCRLPFKDFNEARIYQKGYTQNIDNLDTIAYKKNVGQ